MKKIFAFFFVLLPVLSFAQTKNNISMVTYFPVSYVSYSKVDVAQQTDIGLTADDCYMGLGSSSMPNSNLPLNVVNTDGTPGQLNVQGGTLGLEAPSGTTLAITKQTFPSLSLGGNTSEREGAQLLFNKVYIPQIQHSYSMNSNTMYISGNLKLFGLTGDTTQKTFPSCKTAYTGSTGQMTWEQLSLGKSTQKAAYLTCGGILGCSESTRPTQPRACTLTDVLALANNPVTRASFRALYGDYLAYEPGIFVFGYIRQATGLANPATMGVCGQAVPDPSCDCSANPCVWTGDMDLSNCMVYESPHTPKGAQTKTCSAALGSSEWNGTAYQREYTTCVNGLGTSSLRWDYDECVHWVTYEDTAHAMNGECPLGPAIFPPKCLTLSDKGNFYQTYQTQSTFPCYHANPNSCKKCVPIKHKCWNYGTMPTF